MNRERLIEELKLINIDITESELNQIDEFCYFLIEENKKTNLTAIKNIEDMYLKHIYDSITLTKAIDFKNVETILDIGSGAGFPGIVLKFLYPHLKITLLDSNNKKTMFLKSAGEKFKLKDIEIVHSRAEDYIKNKREYFDLVTGRAVANLRVLSELSIPFVKINGKFIAMKSHIKEELDAAKDTIEILGGEINNIINLELPVENSIRTLLIVEKVSKTETMYPRIYDKIIKYPLKKTKK